MKKVFSLIVAVLFSSLSYGQDNIIDRFFSKYENNADFTVVNVSPKMFTMLYKATSEMEDKEISSLMQGIKGLKMISTEKDGAKYYAEALTKIPTKEYETLVTVKDKGQNIKFLTKGTGDVVNELLLLIGGDKQFMLMSFIGNLDINKIAKLANKINISGSEHLDKIKKN